MPIGLKSSQFLYWANSLTQINTLINYMSFGLVSNPLEISSMKMIMTQSKLVVEKKENIWKKRIESSRWISLKPRRKGLKSQSYLLMKMTQELKELRKNKNRKDNQKKREKLCLSNKELSKRTKDSSKYKMLLDLNSSRNSKRKLERISRDQQPLKKIKKYKNNSD